MVEAKLNWNKENIGKYVKYSLLNGKKNKAFLLIYLLIVSAAAIGGIIFAVITSQMWMIIISVLFVLLIIMYFVLTYFIASNYTAKIMKSFENVKINYIELSEKIISIRNDNIEQGLISWDSIKSAESFNDCVFLTTQNDIIFIISQADITEGSFEELIEIVNKKVKKSD